MAVDATGTPSSPDNIPTYNTGADAPSGKGLNNIVAQIQALFTALRAGTMPGGKIAPAGITPGTNGQVFTTSGGVATWATPASSTVWTVNSTVTVVNTTALTALLSQAIPGGTLGSTRKLRVNAWGDYFNNSGAGKTLRWQITWGGTTLWDVAATANLPSSVNRVPWSIRFELAANADTGHQVLNGLLDIETAPTSGAPTTGLSMQTPGGDGVSAAFASNGTVAVDSTASQTLVLNIAHSAANASTDIRMHHAMIEVVG